MKRTRQIYLGCLMIVLVQCRRHHEFSYGGHRYGPAKWSETWRECGGKRQSPINLDTSKCTGRNFKLKFNNHGEICRGYLINNGACIPPPNHDLFTSQLTAFFNTDIGVPILCFDDSPGLGFEDMNMHENVGLSVKRGADQYRKCNKKKYITGIPFFPKVGYQLAQWHFHFGSKRDWGTEHAINGKRYTAELHMVHFNTKYRTVTNAIDKKDGIAVVAILFEEDPDAQLSSIERFFRKYGSHVNRPDGVLPEVANLSS